MVRWDSIHINTRSQSDVCYSQKLVFYIKLNLLWLVNMECLFLKDIFKIISNYNINLLLFHQSKHRCQA